MLKIGSLLAGAALALCATSAHAAKNVAVDIIATGTGTYDYMNRTNINNRFTHEFTNYYITAYFPLEGSTAPRVSSTGVALGGMGPAPLILNGALSATGFTIGSSYSNFGGAETFNISGNACFNNATPSVIPMGSVAVDPTCGSITATSLNGFVSDRVTFTGKITSLTFREVEYFDLPLITRAIPEPTTWALMLAGFGLTGYALRRRRSRVAFA